MVTQLVYAVHWRSRDPLEPAWIEADGSVFDSFDAALAWCCEDCEPDADMDVLRDFSDDRARMFFVLRHATGELLEYRIECEETCV